jgi:hypothetical protein
MPTIVKSHFSGEATAWTASGNWDDGHEIPISEPNTLDAMPLAVDNDLQTEGARTFVTNVDDKTTPIASKDGTNYSKKTKTKKYKNL